MHQRMKVASRKKDLVGAVTESRYLTEIDIDVFPIDIFVTTRHMNMMVDSLAPFTAIKRRNPPASEANFSLKSFNNYNLPLIYIKSKPLRIFVQDNISEDTGKSDLLLVELKGAILTSQVENPLSRVLVNEDIYNTAAEEGYLEVPGSLVEDRQYQLDLTGISLYTGKWQVRSENARKVKIMNRYKYIAFLALLKCKQFNFRKN